MDQCCSAQPKAHHSTLSAHTRSVLVLSETEPAGVLFIATRDGTYRSVHEQAAATPAGEQARARASRGTMLVDFLEDPSPALHASFTEVAWITVKPHAAAQRSALERHLDVLATGMRIWAQETGQRMPHAWGSVIGARDRYVALTGWPEGELCARRSQSPAFMALMAEVEELAVVDVVHARFVHEGL
ncbi:hypothetical protein FA95DRAFT_1573200 [Auriscalpium vulgare]|uniref:Uncharacterized protein n=1 Tax=Auriscalpium vulgare TaxID=40419 RepID=A0ACB8RQJ1_9AGAM|nr:hypothetical protein FA95DRAFT_1573200 [Auriscalpium vulgare]